MLGSEQGFLFFIFLLMALSSLLVGLLQRLIPAGKGFGRAETLHLQPHPADGFTGIGSNQGTTQILFLFFLK